MTSGSDEFYAFEQSVSFYRFLTKALGWNDKGMVLADGCSGQIGNKIVDKKFLNEAYELGKSIV
ncbi:hypothetical protein SD457_16515 [Coprobacillaceae bacterium CR2/5/TPMF4]|nr:hypothetical protein SD457_16515 [Coprobacillaceae bacterium CR2/5/TPMF4]